MPPAYWLVKSEPFKYSWDQLVDDGRTYWDGVRNYEARNNLQAMKVGDLALYYHSNEGKEVVGVARIVREAYPDPTTDEEAWVVVDVEPVQRFEAPVTLADIKAEPALSEMFLIRRGRISVVPVRPAEWKRVLAMGKTTLRPGAKAEKLPEREPPKRNPSARKAAAAKARQAGTKTAKKASKTSARKAVKKKAAKKRSAKKKAAKKKSGAPKSAKKRASAGRQGGRGR